MPFFFHQLSNSSCNSFFFHFHYYLINERNNLSFIWLFQINVRTLRYESITCATKIVKIYRERNKMNIKNIKNEI
nr:MAG TPA: hypothetical protein [Caudoviricetes sp.]